MLFGKELMAWGAFVWTPSEAIKHGLLPEEGLNQQEPRTENQGGMTSTSQGECRDGYRQEVGFHC